MYFSLQSCLFPPGFPGSIYNRSIQGSIKRIWHPFSQPWTTNSLEISPTKCSSTQWCGSPASPACTWTYALEGSMLPQLSLPSCRGHPMRYMLELGMWTICKGELLLTLLDGTLLFSLCDQRIYWEPTWRWEGYFGSWLEEVQSAMLG